MSYIEDKIAQAKGLVGRRIELPVHCDAWMQGARFGTVTSVGPNGDYVRVRMDHPAIKVRLRVWRIDFDYIRQID